MMVGHRMSKLKEYLRDAFSLIVLAISCGILISSMVNWNSQRKSISVKSEETVENNYQTSSCLSVIWSNGSTFYAKDIFGKKRIVFVTTTKQTLTQVATLTKIGQALFPVRDKVVWVVVSLTTDKDVVYKGGKAKETKLRMLWEGIIPGESGMQRYLSYVDKTLRRFGVPYVLINSNSLKISPCCVSEWNFVDSVNDYEKFNENQKKEEMQTRDGYRIGVIWALDHFRDGILMLGNEEWSYHNRIFKQVYDTKTVSVWPVGLGKWVGFSTPIWDFIKKALIGYLEGDDFLNRPIPDILMTRGTFAISIGVLLMEPEKVSKYVWWIASDKLKLSDFSIPMSKAQLLCSNGTEILVWRTGMTKKFYPTTLQFYMDTNMNLLHQNLLGVYYDQIPVADPNADND